jgi:hypothetical protein
MKTLEEEAAEWARRNIQWSDGFIAGANSKWVQAEKIKAQIDCWEKALKIIPREDEDSILLLVKKLKQQLKQLEE